MNMNDNDYITILPKRGLKTSQYKESMDKKDLKRGLKTSQYKESMDKKDLKKLSKSQLIKLLSKRDSINKPIPPPRTEKWKNVKSKQMVKEYEDIIQPPEQFRNKQGPPKPTRKPPPPPILQLEEKEHITNVPSYKDKGTKLSS